MAHPSIIRVRLDLRKISESLHPSLIWLSCDTSVIHTIEDLKNLIIKRLNILDIDVNLYCQDCYLPSDETIAIVRDEDLIRIHYKDQRKYVREKYDSYFNCFGWPSERECKISHKKRKKNSSDDVREASSDNDIKRKKMETEICNNAENNTWKKKHNKEKKQKHTRHESESSTPLKLDALSPIMQNDYSSEKINKKRKKHVETTEMPIAFEDNSTSTIPVSTESGKVCANSLQQIDLEPTPVLDSADKGGDKVSTVPYERTDKSAGNNCKKKRKRSRKRKNKTNDSFAENMPEFENKESVNKDYLENNNKSSLEQLPSLPINKHVKFTDTEENDLTYRASSEEKPVNQNTSQIQPFSSNEPSFVTSSPLQCTVQMNGLISTNQKKKDSENSMNSRTNCMKLVTSIQNKYKELSKERQLAAVNTNRSTIYTNKSLHNGTFIGEKRKLFIPTEKKDYKKYPLLKGPPRAGDIIAYKILELSADYCPQMSDYKEGKVINYNDETDDIEVELTTIDNPGRNKGKFDLPTSESEINPPEELVKENTVTVNWAAMVEPRLLS